MIVTGDDLAIEPQVAVEAPVRARRSTVATPPRPVGISREAEFAYIRSDMRRLVVIAGALLALMLLLLVLVNR